MLRTPITRTVLLAALVGLMLTACGGSTTGTTSDDGMDMDEMFGFGEPAEAADADRSIEIIANDDFSFDPNEITVTAGETINFRVTNPGISLQRRKVQRLPNVDESQVSSKMPRRNACGDGRHP